MSYSFGQEFPSVLPATDQGELEGITIRVTGKVERAFFTERTVTVSEDKLQPHKIRLIHCKKWKPDRDLPSPPQSLLHLAEHMEELRRASPGSVVMISCCDGYSGSGLFVALSRMMAELQLSKQVDVYRTVQSVMFDRPQFIINERQYLYLHDAVLVYFKVQKMIQGSQQKETARKQNKTMEGSTTATARELAARTSLQEAESMAMVREREANKRIEARGNGNIGNKGNKSALRHTISYGESTENEEIKYDPGRVSDAPEYRDHGAKPRKLKHPVYENIWQ
ncbi:Receptor-type tyrosine-protein phosphatase beta [Chionoecetes opilio]|uniref:Receptor-type tyrosine-protein phosphatase beta n=1 Tax=Chionoecetes opilio TaxID=41210 RepID=A0A8J5CMI7_CHIOP|nr:Receptor-type tyrosine-protein phosphatase beta [Chionoecetes opilio]